MTGPSLWRILGILVSAFLLLSVTLVLGHPGGLDAYGGHNDRKHGGYHFHRGVLAGQTFATKEEALAALAGAGKPAEQSPAKAAVKPSADRTEVLIRLLVRKGVITEQELTAELNR